MHDRWSAVIRLASAENLQNERYKDFNDIYTTVY